MAGLMIAEDELIERMVLKKMLQKKFGEQCTIYEAQNGHEAVELARREEIQVIILDIGMPGMNGIQAAKIIRREHPECCIIFLTAYDRFEYARSAISVGAMEYLLKPYSSREIIHVTGEALHLADRYRTWRAGKMEPAGMEPVGIEPVEPEQKQRPERMGPVRLGLVKLRLVRSCPSLCVWWTNRIRKRKMMSRVPACP